MTCFKRTFHHQINVITTPAFSQNIGGTIQIESNLKIKCEWRHDSNTALLQLSDDRKTAYNVPPGAYSILCISDKKEYVVKTVVNTIKIPSIQNYIVQHATSDTARDGKIEVLVQDLNYTNVSYLWTSGVITNEPVLYDVRPGIYSVSIISKDKLPVPFYHFCSPALVNIEDLRI